MLDVLDVLAPTPSGRDHRGDRNRVYEQILQEGTDVRYFVDADELLAMWDDIVLPPWVRKVWAGWFRRHRGIEASC